MSDITLREALARCRALLVESGTHLEYGDLWPGETVAERRVKIAELKSEVASIDAALSPKGE